jgi:3-oxoacyl-[acyl-carrier protein] reductase
MIRRKWGRMIAINTEENIPLKHRGEDQDIANVVAFLASDLAKFITGAFIPVNGGGATLPDWL